MAGLIISGGKVVGVDTGKQSVQIGGGTGTTLPTKSKTSSGGGGGSSGGGSSSTSNAISQVLTPTENKIASNVEKLSKSQQSFYQKLLNEGKISLQEANSQLKNVVGKYAEELIKKESPNINFEKIISNKTTSSSIKQNLQESANIEASFKKTYKPGYNEEYINQQIEKMTVKNMPENPLFRNTPIALIIKKNKAIQKPINKFIQRTASNIVLMPLSLYRLIQNPANILSVPKAIKEDLIDTLKLIRISQTEAIAKVGADVFTVFIGGKTIKLTGKISSNIASKVSNKFRGVKNLKGKIIIKTPTQIITKEKAIIKQPEIIIKKVNRIPTESLASQAGLAGKTVNAVSSQADALVSMIKRNKIVRKPIPNEARLPNVTKRLLKKFDKGSITSRELIKLDKQIRGQGVKIGFGGKAKGILERSFFADPRTRLRPSRLGLEAKEGNIIDLISGKATIRKGQKPQILLFEKTKIQNFPKSLSSVKSKLLKNIPLSNSETRALLKWQMKKTGKFKPVGFLSRESEITVSPGEIIKRVRKLGTARINGKNIPIISAKIAKSTKETKILLEKLSKNKISNKDMNKLSRRLSKETGFKYSNKQISSYGKKGKMYYPVKRKLGSSLVRKVTKSYKPSSKTSVRPRYSPTYKPSSKTSVRPRYSPTYKPSSKTSVRPRYSPTYKPTINTRKNVSLRLTNNKISQLKNRQETFNIYGKSGKKFIKLNKMPLTRKDALSRGAFAIDNTTAKTFKIKPAGFNKRVGSITSKEKGYFNNNKFKLRGYKVKGGKTYKVKPTYIERRKYGIDTRGEKKQLSLAKFAKQRR